MDRFLDDFGQENYDSLALIRYHVWWPGQNDPFYLATTSFVNTRVNYYGLNFVPWPAVDGVYSSSNFAFENMFNQDVGEDSPFQMDVSVEAIGDSMDVSVEIYAEGDPGTGDLSLRIAVTETDIHYQSAYGEIWNDVMRTMVPDAAGTPFTIAQGETLQINGYFTMDPVWQMPNLAVIAFIQDNDGLEIMQGARWTAPAGTVAGTVESEGGDPVEDALVTLLETGRFDSTDAAGAFELSYLVGNFDLETRAIAHYPDTTTVDIFDDSTTTVGITLTPLPLSLFAGTVTDSATGEGIEAKVVLLMNDEPWDSAFTNPTTGFFHIQDVPITFPGIQEYTGIEVYPELPYPITTLTEDITVTVEDTATLFPELNPAQVFLVDGDEGMTYEEYYIPAIDSTGRTYVHLDTETSGTPPAEALALFPVSTKLVWFTGNAESATLTQAEQDSVANFLEAGGKLFLTGQNIAEDLASLQSSFLEDYLHVGWIENIAYAFTHGVPGDPLGRNLEYLVTAGGNGANNQTSRDRLEILEGAVESFHYTDSPVGTTNLGTAGIWTEGPVAGSRIVFFGFGFEAINRPGGIENQATRSQTMQIVLDFLDGITGIEDPDDAGGVAGLPKSFALSQNYPNPFNPQTSIVYDVPASAEGGSRIVLSIYNVRGKKVRTLVEDWKKPGTYLVQWDGRNDQGEELSSGVYFSRLEAGEFVQTRKLVLLK